MGPLLLTDDHLVSAYTSGDWRYSRRVKQRFDGLQGSKMWTAISFTVTRLMTASCKFFCD
ncbi:hypothetical protein BY996DRAFT_6473070 [Phakopsora pachyrhizi]|nr:hypothetical protein BY996DRAFT_6473070 [Phakopsora pachyrhizi]